VDPNKARNTHEIMIGFNASGMIVLWTVDVDDRGRGSSGDESLTTSADISYT
jgi:hypothetical protein